MAVSFSKGGLKSSASPFSKKKTATQTAQTGQTTGMTQQQATAPASTPTPETIKPDVSNTDKLPLGSKLVNSGVSWNPDGSVNYSVSSPNSNKTQSFKLTAQEYKGLLGNRGGLASQQVKAIQELEKQTRIQSMVRQGATTQDIINALVAQRSAATGINMDTPDGASLISDMTGKMTNIPSMSQMESQAEQQVGSELPTFQKDIAQNPNASTSEMIVKAGAGIGARALNLAAQAYDSVHSAISGKKPIRVQNAEQAFSDASTAIDQEIALVKLGHQSPDDALRSMDTAMQSIVRLEQTTKDMGKFNVRYFADNGAAIQASIENEKAILKNKRDDLISAIQQAKLNEAAAYYGNPKTTLTA